MKKVAMAFCLGILGVALNVPGAARGHEEEKGHAHESVKFEELPAVVQATFTRESKGGKIEELRKETRKNGKVIYEGEIVKNGKGWDIEVNAEGKVVERGKPHSEEGEHEGK